MTGLAASLDGIEAVVFDLDGTLVDTLPDLADAINRMLAEEGRPALDAAAVKRMIGDGAMMLVERALAAAGPTRDAEACAALRRRFLEYYTAAVSRRSRPYAGVVETLGALRTAGLRLGVCTNKPFAPTQRLLADLDLAGFFAAVVGGDSTEAKKPDGRHLLTTLDSLGAAPGGAGHADASRADLDRLITKYFLRLVDHLHLFASVAFVLERADLRDQVERDRIIEGFVRVVLTIKKRAAAGDQVFLALHACPTSGLVSAHHDTANLASVVQRLHGQYHLRDGAVGAGEDALVVERRLGIDLGHHQRHLRIHPPVSALVDDHAVALDSPRAKLCRHGIRRAADRQVDAIKRLRAHEFDRVPFALERECLAGRTL